TAEVSENLVRIFRATNLARLGAASTFSPAEFEVNFRIVRPAEGDSAALRAGDTPRVHPADQVHLAAQNGSGKPIDMNVLYIGSDYSVSYMYGERLHAGSK